MRLKKTSVCGAIVMVAAFPNTAAADVVSVEMAQSKANCNAPGHIPIIEVAGNKRGKYNRVKTRELWTCLKVRGEQPGWSRNGKGGTVSVETNSRTISTPKGTDIHGVAFAYVGPLSAGGTYRQDPVAMCNQAIKGLTGSKREQFISQGTYITVEKAYKVGATATWEIRKSKIAASPNFYRFDHKQWAAANTIPALIQCLPTGKPAASPAGNADVPAPGRRTNPVPQPPRVNPPPTISTLKVEAAPMDIERVGNWMCPTKLRLNGRIDVIRPFSGASIFVGPQWLSPKTDIKLQGAKGRNVIAVYSMNWDRTGQGSLSVSSQTPSRQTLTFKFNVTDAAGKLLKTASKTVSVVCKRPTQGAGDQAVGEVTGN